MLSLFFFHLYPSEKEEQNVIVFTIECTQANDIIRKNAIAQRKYLGNAMCMKESGTSR